MSRHNKVRSVLFASLSVPLGLASSLLMLEVALRFMPVPDSYSPEPVNETNPVLRFAPNRDFVYSRGWNFAIHARKRINNYGFFNSQEYINDDERQLLAVIGDSYIEALQVNDHETMHEILAAQAGTNTRVYSFACSGTPLAGYLAYLDYARKHFSPNAVVVVIVANDFAESLSKYRLHPGHYHFGWDADGHPYLIREDFTPSQLRRLFSHSALFRYLFHAVGLKQWRNVFSQRKHAPRYVGNVEAESSAEKLADSISAVNAFFSLLQVYADLPSSRVLFVIDGPRPSLYDEAELAGIGNTYFGQMRDYFIRQARAWGYEVVDMQPVFREHYIHNRQRFEFQIDGHWNALGHALVANQVMRSRMYENFSRSVSAKSATLHR